jgi:hypothetical protein
MLVLHDDAKLAYSYGPAMGPADTEVGVVTPALFDEATKQGWIVVSMKSNWKEIFAFARYTLRGCTGHGTASARLAYGAATPMKLSCIMRTGATTSHARKWD